jgi:hypothetical protein
VDHGTAPSARHASKNPLKAPQPMSTVFTFRTARQLHATPSGAAPTPHCPAAVSENQLPTVAELSLHCPPRALKPAAASRPTKRRSVPMQRGG